MNNAPQFHKFVVLIGKSDPAIWKFPLDTYYCNLAQLPVDLSLSFCPIK